MCVCVLSLSAMSDSLQPHELYTTRLLSPWDCPGKNTGVGCHTLLQGDLHDLGIAAKSPSLQAGSLPSELPGKPQDILSKHYIRRIIKMLGIRGDGVINSTRGG